MAATIQTVQKPLRARAWDTSTSQQPTHDIINDGVFANNVAESTTGTYWITGDDCVIGSGSATWTNDSGDSSGNCTQTNLAHSIVNGATYRVTFTLSGFNQHGGSGGFRIKLYGSDGYSAIGTTRTANDTYTEDLTLTSAGASESQQVIIQTYGDPMSGTVDNISVHKLESFGNNNHGQIYSGRALEFDGVTDYIVTTDPFNYTPITISCWVNTADDSDYKTIFSNRKNGTNSGILLYLGGSEGLTFKCEGNVQTSAVPLDPGAWYHVVATYDGSTQNVYVNGVLKATIANPNGALDTDTNAMIGGDSLLTSGSQYFMNGMLSNLQIWNATWSVSDALFAYQNPEQLVLSNSGTSLTESNLKGWYPMNDGHRGQQSYILDASNTGLGSDDLITNGSMEGTWSTDDAAGDGILPEGWRVDDGTDGLVVSQETGVTGYALGVLGGSTSHIAEQRNISFVSGTTYKLTATGRLLSGSGTGKIRLLSATIGASANVIEFDSTEWETKSTYFTAEGGSYLRLYTNDTSVKCAFDNISIKAVNDKNHGTTVFYGDHLYSAADSGLTSTGIVQAVGSTVSASHTGTIAVDGATITNALILNRYVYKSSKKLTTE